jgi:2'-5' RNA ligase
VSRRGAAKPTVDRASAAQRERPAARRLFIAVPLPEAAIGVIAELVGGVRQRVPGADTVRWVRLDGLHVTVRFLGPVEEASVERLIRVVDDVAGSSPRFEVSVSGGGAFPAMGRPRALWLGLAHGADALAALAADLGPRLEPLGWPLDDRPFRAHLTLARSDGVKAGAAVARELRASAEHLELRFLADRLVLFETLTGGGPARYVPLHEASLGRPSTNVASAADGAGDTIAAEDPSPRAGRKGALGTA